MTKETFLLLNLCLAFYNAGTIWTHEITHWIRTALINFYGLMMLYMCNNDKNEHGGIIIL